MPRDTGTAIGDGDPATLPGPGPRNGALGLSAAQRRLWLAAEIAPDSAEFTVPWAVRVRGPLDVDTLAAAWEQVLYRHPEVRLRIGESGRTTWPVADLAPRVRSVTPAELDEELARSATRVLDLGADPLVELAVLRLNAQECVLLLTGHHIVLDARSMTLIEHDLFAYYTGRDPGAAPPAYTGYVDWERTSSAPPPDKLDAWLSDLKVPPARRPLGLSDARPEHTKRGLMHTEPVPAQLWAAVRETARAHRTTPQVMGMTAVGLTLREYLGTEDLILGGTMDVRPSDFADTVGMFINPAPIRLRLPEGQPVPELLTAAQLSLLRAHQFRHVPFEDVVRRLGITPDPARTPLFQVLFNYEPVRTHPEVPGLTITSLDIPTTVAKYDLIVALRDCDGSAELVTEYRADRYTEAQIGRFVRHVRAALGILASGRPITSVLDEPDLAGLLALGTAPAPAEPEAVHTVVEAVTAAAPGRPSVTCAGETLTYQQLRDRAGAVAAELARTGIGAGDLVGVLMERSAAMVAAVLGTLLAGAAYVPLDPANPDERIAAVLADSGVATTLVTATTAERLAGHPCVVVDELTGSTPAVPVTNRDAAYVIYTSGTTGEPKGVLVDHANLAASTAARREVYPERAVFLLVSPLAFDSCAAGLWGTLTSGGHLVIPETPELLDPDRLLGLIAEHGVTQLLCVPSLYAVLLAAIERGGGAASLTRVIVAGEPLPDAVLRQHFALLPGVELVNEYGPTEATVWSSYRRYREAGPVDIGGPVPGAQLYVLDERDRPVPHGVLGELHVGGPGVATGYLGRPGATATAFPPDPFAGPGRRMYRTGDLVRWTDAGTLEFLGRRDHQVKIRGYRVEIGAVEAALRGCPGVRDAVVEPAPDGQRLIAYLTGEPDLDPAAVRGRLTELLPDPMVPASLTVLDAFPLTPNGKVDRAALAETATSQPAAAEPEPGDDLVTSVAAAWCEALGIETVPTDANFFDIGGYSLLVPTLQALLHKHTGSKPSIVDLFAHPTVTLQAELLTPPAGGPDLITSVAAAWCEALGIETVPADANFFDIGGYSLLVPTLQALLHKHTGSKPSIVDLFAHPTVTLQAELLGAAVAPAEPEGGDRRARMLAARARRSEAA